MVFLSIWFFLLANIILFSWRYNFTSNTALSSKTRDFIVKEKDTGILAYIQRLKWKKMCGKTLRKWVPCNLTRRKHQNQTMWTKIMHHKIPSFYLSFLFSSLWTNTAVSEMLNKRQLCYNLIYPRWECLLAVNHAVHGFEKTSFRDPILSEGFLSGL